MVMEEPEVGPDALKTSSRVMAIRTGRPDFFDSAMATGSTYTTVLPPNPPPISAGLTFKSAKFMPSILAVKPRTTK